MSCTIIRGGTIRDETRAEMWQAGEAPVTFVHVGMKERQAAGVGVEDGEQLACALFKCSLQLTRRLVDRNGQKCR